MYRKNSKIRFLFSIALSFIILLNGVVVANAEENNDLFSRASLNDTVTMTVSADPSDNTGVAVDNNIYLYFNNGVHVPNSSGLVDGKLNGDLIKLEQVSGTPDSNPVTVEINVANQSEIGNTPIIVTPTNELEYNTQYKLTLSAGLTANNGGYTTVDTVIAFTTIEIPVGAPGLSGAVYNGSEIKLSGLSDEATNLECRVAADGSSFEDWTDLTANVTTAAIATAVIHTGTAKIEVREKADDSNPASASATTTIYAAFDSDIPLTADVQVIYKNGLKINPDQLNGDSTVNVRNANGEIPQGAYALIPKNGLAPAFYGINVKSSDASYPSVVTVSLPLSSLDSYDINKINVYRMDTTYVDLGFYGDFWIPMLETYKDEINSGTIKVTLRNLGNKGINEVIGVFEDPLYSINTVSTEILSQTETSVTLKIKTWEYGVAKFKIYRNGLYISDSTGPIVQEAETNEYTTTFTDTAPGPGTYVYNATAVDYGGNEFNDLTNFHADTNDATVVFGSGQSDAAGVIAAVKAGLQDGSIDLGFADGDSGDSVTQDINLPGYRPGYAEVPIPNANITWTSNRPDVFYDKTSSATTELRTLFSSDSNILKPAGEEEVSLVLTATITSDLDHNCLSDTLEIPITVRWTSEAHVCGPVEFERAINNSTVQTILVDSLTQYDDDSGFVQKSLTGTYDCQDKTIRGYLRFGDGLVLKNAVIDVYGRYYGKGGDPAPLSITGGVTLDNVTVTGLENAAYGLYIRTNDFKTDSDNIVITNCNFESAKKAAIYIRQSIEEDNDNYDNGKVRYKNGGNPSSITISGNTFDGGGNPGYAIIDSVGKATITNNTIRGYHGTIEDMSLEDKLTINQETCGYGNVANMPSAGIFINQDTQAELSSNIIYNCDNGIMVWTGEELKYRTYINGYIDTENTKTAYANINGTQITDASNAEEAGMDLLTTNVITLSDGEGNRSVAFKNAADENNLVLLYDSTVGTKMPVTVYADTKNGQFIQLTYDHDLAWESAVIGVKVNGVALNNSKYLVGSGTISIVRSVFNEAGDYNIIIEATGYSPVLVTQSIEETPLQVPPVLTAPLLIAPPNDEVVDFTFVEDAAWRSAITSVTLTQTNFALGQTYECSFDANTPGYLAVTLNGSYWSYIITVKALGYDDAQIMMNVYGESPVLIPDTSGNSVGQDIDVNFDAVAYGEWESFITDVKVNGESLNSSQCLITWGNIHIDGSVFTEAGVYDINVKSGCPTGKLWLDTSFEQEIVGTAPVLPNLVPQSSDNYLGNDITLTFIDDQTWREAVSGVYLNGILIDSSLYTVEQGDIKLSSNVFDEVGTYTITVKASGYDDAKVTQFIAPVAVNLPPIVHSDTTDLMTNKSIDLTFDDVLWQSKITGLTYCVGDTDNTEYVIPGNKYEITDGNINILPNVFPADLIKVYIKAEGYSDVSCRMRILSPNQLELYPPVLTADTTDNVLGQAMDITFTDADWRNYVYSVAVNNTALTFDQFTVSAGKISIAANAFSQSGNYTITVKAANLPYDSFFHNFSACGVYYSDAVVSQTIVNPKYSLTVVEDSVYTASIENNFNIMTVNSGVTGFKYFTVNTTPVNIYNKQPMVIFVQFRNNVQIALSASSVANDKESTVVCGFSVKAGDVIKAYVVDRLTNDKDINPIVLQ